MKQNNHGFSLIETVVAMAILGAFSVSIASCLVLSLRMNEKTDALMKEQMAVSSAVETLMATGIPPVDAKTEHTTENGTKITIEPVTDAEYYTVAVSNGNVTVTTQIREAVSAG